MSASRYYKNGAVIGIIGFLIFIGAAHAQSLPEPVMLTASPEFPSPEDTVVVEATTPTFDKDTAVFNWVVNGTVRPDVSGTGKNSVSFIAGAVGSITRVSVEILPLTGETATADIQVPVADLSLPWFAETYTPKWYKGKALPVRGSVVDVVAIPNIIVEGSVLRPENLIYRWTLDDEPGKLIGIGKNLFRVQLSDRPGSPSRVSVVVEDTNKQIRKERSVTINSFYPKVLVYSASPLGGVEIRHAPENFSTALKGLLDFVAEPFFFPVLSKSDLSYQWTLADNDIQGKPNSPYLLTIDTGQTSGTVPMSVAAREAQEGGVSARKLIDLILQ